MESRKSDVWRLGTNLERGKGAAQVPHNGLLDFGDLLTSPNDPGPFYGYHANADRSNMEWMINTEEELEEEMWGYPSSKNDVGDIFSMAGPYPIYPLMACAIQPDVFPEYSLFNKWIPGTMLEDVVNSGFPFDTLFDKGPANEWGYTHEESKFQTHYAQLCICFWSLATVSNSIHCFISTLSYLPH